MIETVFEMRELIMTLTNEDLLAISQLLDVKLKAEIQPIKNEIQTLQSELQTEIQAVRSKMHAEVHQIKLFQENVIMPQLNLITDCYASTYHRYKDSVEGYEALLADNEVMKTVIMEHSEKLQKLA